MKTLKIKTRTNTFNFQLHDNSVVTTKKTEEGVLELSTNDKYFNTIFSRKVFREIFEKPGVDFYYSQKPMKIRIFTSELLELSLNGKSLYAKTKN